MEKEMKYVAPEVEVLEAMVELGFAGSIDPDEGNQTPSIPDGPF